VQLRLCPAPASWVAQVCSTLGPREQETGDTCFLGGSGGWKQMPPVCNVSLAALQLQ
jgi:hypothetical protein